MSEEKKCPAKTKKGSPCKNSRMKNSKYCYIHCFGKLNGVPFLKNPNVHFIIGLVITIFIFLIGPSVKNQKKMLGNDDASLENQEKILANVEATRSALEEALDLIKTYTNNPTLFYPANATNMPFLEPKLIVDNITSNTISFFFNVRNRSIYQIEEITFLYKSSQGGAESFVTGRMYGAPKACTLKTDEATKTKNFIVNSPKDGAIDINLTCIYKLKQNEVLYSAYMTFGFALHPRFVQKAEYDAEGFEPHNKPISLQEVNKEMDMNKMLSAPQGTIQSTIKTRTSGIPQVFYHGSTKSLFYEPNTDQLVLQLIRNDGSLDEFRKTLRPSVQKGHRLPEYVITTSTWGNGKFTLYWNAKKIYETHL